MKKRLRIPGPLHAHVVTPMVLEPAPSPIRTDLFTKAERLEHLGFVADLLAQFANERQILRAMRQRFGEKRISRMRVANLTKQVLKEWTDADPLLKADRRAKQIVALETAIVQLGASLRADGLSKTEMLGIQAEKRRHIELLSAITGTQTPTEVNVHMTGEVKMSGAVQHVIGQLSTEQVSEMLALAQEDMRLANEMRRLKAASITVEGVAAE